MTIPSNENTSTSGPIALATGSATIARPPPKIGCGIMLETSRSEYLSDSSLHDGLDDAQEQRLVSLLDPWMIGLENGETPDREKLLAENEDFKAQLLDAIESIELLHRIEIPVGPTRRNKGTLL